MNHTGTSLKENLLSYFDDILVEISDEHRLTISCKKDSVITILSSLNRNGYNHLALISCVDWIKDNELELVYIISAYTEDSEKGKMNILVKTKIAREKPELLTVMSIYENAEPYERELHELYGINFKGHPRLIPLLLEREYEIPPFRKDFDTRKYVQDVFDKIPFVEDKKGRK
ncbi:MAG: NADH-quinone oxidoreductase subunit C [Bacteroidales bacterium]|nr:NADH-quinone oxidoreductase subunit C [Bacteroidales bacterium]